ncbi:MAG TPA: nucleoside monophosphate kinase [Acidimicrobiales bacterium]|nr:nucleoside monophosphate kinase [Acidimicrobiales bacterium]
MHLILLGAPGSGKGTQGSLLAEHFGAQHISSGQLLRAHLGDATAFGKRIEDYVRTGELVPDEVVLELLRPAVTAAVADGGYVLDGFPRTLRQAELAFREAVPMGATADAVVYLAVPDEIVRQRLAGRSEGRVDDGSSEVTERRLRIFHAETEPLLDYYRSRGLLVTIDAAGPAEEVTAATIAALEAR